MRNVCHIQVESAFTDRKCMCKRADYSLFLCKANSDGWFPQIVNKIIINWEREKQTIFLKANEPVYSSLPLKLLNLQN